jgi:hypothetical protein
MRILAHLVHGQLVISRLTPATPPGQPVRLEKEIDMRYAPVLTAAFAHAAAAGEDFSGFA